MMRTVALLVALVGIGLLAINLAGVRDPPSLPSPAMRFPARYPATVKGSLDLRPGEPDERFFRRVTLSLHSRIAHYWAPDVDRVALTDNYILNLLGHVFPEYRRFEFADADRAANRGYGWCTQYALAVASVLRRNGFSVHILSERAHTVATSTTHDGRPMILDADFGVVVPVSATTLLRHPERLRTFYASLNPLSTPLPRSSPSQVADFAVSTFSERWQIHSVGTQAGTVEDAAYLLKWLIPVLLLAGSMSAYLITRRQ